jgi:hypothetical protein
MPPTVTQLAGRPSGTHAFTPSQARTPHVPETQSEFVVQGRHSVESKQSVDWQAHPDPQAPVAGPLHVALTVTHRPVAPHHPQPGRGVHVAQDVPDAHGSPVTSSGGSERSRVVGTSSGGVVTQGAHDVKAGPEAVATHRRAPRAPLAQVQSNSSPTVQAVGVGDGVGAGEHPTAHAKASKNTVNSLIKSSRRWFSPRNH